jgi:hypothetical protein
MHDVALTDQKHPVLVLYLPEADGKKELLSKLGNSFLPL